MESKLKCLVIDDEPAGRKMLEDYIAETEFLELAGSVSNPTKATAILEQEQIGLIFLDVQMPKMSGIEFLRSLQNPPLVIMVTAFSEYALQGYELDVTDYLLKPVSKERFVKACVKAKEIFDLKNNMIKSETPPEYFFIKCNGQFEKINFSELLFLEASNNYVVLQTREKRFTTYLTFKAASEHLPTDRFLKVHKSFVVALDKIESIDREKIRIEDYRIPISRGMKAAVMDRVLKKNLVKR
jgi:DNA-binding LytR/AlgR family response regulator